MNTKAIFSPKNAYYLPRYAMFLNFINYLCRGFGGLREAEFPHGTQRRDGRVVDYSGLENRRTERYRGFESLSLRR